MIRNGRLIERREGSALLFALFVILLMELVVIGVVHVATLERRIASGSVSALRLRLAADAAVAHTAAQWPSPLDTLVDAEPGTARTLTPVSIHPEAAVGVVARALHGDGWHLIATASAPATGTHATHAALLRSPLIPRWVPGSGISASGLLEVASSGEIPSPAECSGGPPPPHLAARIAADATGRSRILGPVVTDPRLPAHIAAMLREIGRSTGNVPPIHHGDLTIRTGEHVTGMLIVSGNVLIEENATVTGAIVADGEVRVHGVFEPDPCAALAALAPDWLRPRSFGRRTVVPAFQ